MKALTNFNSMIPRFYRFYQEAVGDVIQMLEMRYVFYKRYSQVLAATLFICRRNMMLSNQNVMIWKWKMRVII